MRLSKKIPGLLLLILIAFQPGCKKKNNDTVAELTAHVRYGGDPYADGIGYNIQLDSSREIVIPINLPTVYKHTDIDTVVAVRLIDAGKRFVFGGMVAGTPGLRGVYIATIRGR